MNDTIKVENKGNVQMIAHRGVSGLEAENTCASFLAAGNRSYYGIETDVWWTADQKYLCNHDGRTGRVCDVDLVIYETDFDTLRALRLKDVDGNSDRGDLCIPTLYEYAKICKRYGKIAVTELKPYLTEEQVRQIMQVFEDMDYLDNVIFISFDMRSLELVKAVRPEQRCQFLALKWDDGLATYLEKLGMDIDIAYWELTEERVRFCHEHGLKVNCWTVDDHEVANQMINWGVDYITTNILE